jgi:hypothetical protein
MANLALVRDALEKALAAKTMNNARYYIGLALSHLPPPLDPNIQYPDSLDMVGPFPEEGTDPFDDGGKSHSLKGDDR